MSGRYRQDWLRREVQTVLRRQIDLGHLDLTEFSNATVWCEEFAWVKFRDEIIDMAAFKAVEAYLNQPKLADPSGASELEPSPTFAGLAISIVNGNGVATDVGAAQARRMTVRTVKDPI